MTTDNNTYLSTMKTFMKKKMYLRYKQWHNKNLNVYLKGKERV